MSAARSSSPMVSLLAALPALQDQFQALGDQVLHGGALGRGELLGADPEPRVDLDGGADYVGLLGLLLGGGHERGSLFFGFLLGLGPWPIPLMRLENISSIFCCPGV